MRHNIHFIGTALVLGLIMAVVGPRPTPVSAQQPAGPPSLCTTTVQLPPAPARGGGGGAGGGAARGGGAGGGGAAAGGAGGRQNAPPSPADLPNLKKIKDDVYVIQNQIDTVAQIGPFGGNVTIYLTDDGVILIDSKNAQMHDDIMAKVKSLTDKPIKYVVLTHNHGDHTGGAAKMQEIGATLIISEEDRQNMARTGNAMGLPQIAYHGEGQVWLGGKEVRLREFCGHTNGDTVALLPAARVVVVGDLVTTPDTIPQIVNYGDKGNWTDMGKSLDEIGKMDFDFLVGGHGPVLSKADFIKYKDTKVAGIRERVREMNKQGKTQEEIAASVLKDFGYTNAGQIGQMMNELK